MRRFGLITAFAAGLVLPAMANAQGVQLVPFGQQSYPAVRYIAGEPGDPSRIYVVEGAGRIRLVENGATNATAFLDIAADVCFSGAEPCGGESGLFSMALASDYATSGLFYVFYTRDSAVAGEQHYLRIEEFRRSTVNPDVADPATRRILLEIPHLDETNHNGGQLQFGPDGLLYISTGDGGGSNDPDANAQNPDSLLGKLLRIDPTGDAPFEYGIPADNPFAGAAPGAGEVYSYGLRNPYRFSFDRLTGDLTIGDVGQGAWEEIDFVSNGGGSGANFGWDCFEGTDLAVSMGQPQCVPLPTNHTPPVIQYARTDGGAAVNGGYVVRDTALPTLLGRYLYADTLTALANQIFSAELFPGGASGNAPTGLTANFVTSFGEDACGHVYVAHGGSMVSRIEPTNGGLPCAPQTALPPSTQSTPAIDSAGPGLRVVGRKGRRAGARGAVILSVGCDERCTVHGAGSIALPGKDILLDPDSTSLAAGAAGDLHLDLSRKQARRLLGELRDGHKAKAFVEVTAADLAGNQSVAERRIKQKR